MEYISVKEASEKWGLSTRRIQILCTGGRIDGADRIGNMWVIPKDAEKPKDANLIHAHHIDYFTQSLNNDMNNIMIVCPNHHGIIHDRNPRFDWKSLEYLYPNGYREGLKLNDHLKRTRQAAQG